MTQAPLATMADAGDLDEYAGCRGYSPYVDEKMAGAITWEIIKGFFIRSLIFALVGFVTGIVLGGFLAAVGALDSGAALGFSLLVMFGLGAGSFFFPFREGLSEWQLLLASKAPSAESSYAAIYGTLTQRGFPVRVSSRRFVTAGNPSVNNYLVICDGNVTAYVSVFAYGTSLFLGWSMWRKRLPVVIMFRFVLDAVGAAFGRDNLFVGQIGSNRARAFREAVHASVREGVDAATYGVDLTIAGTFGSDIPIETLGSNSSTSDSSVGSTVPLRTPPTPPRPSPPAKPTAPAAPAAPASGAAPAAPPTPPVPQVPPAPGGAR